MVQRFIKLTNLPAYILTALVFIYSAISFYRIVVSFAPDFSVFYGAALTLIEGGNPYLGEFFTAYEYPVFSSLFFLPFVWINYPTAQFIFTLISYLAVIFVVYYSIVLSWQKVFPAFYFLLALTLLSFPVKFTFGMGQVNLIAYCLVIISYYLFTKNKQTAAGLLLGLGIIVKPVLLIVLVFYLFQKSWRLLIWSGSVIVLGFIVAGLLFGFNLYEYYFMQRVPFLLRFSGREVYYNQGISGLVARLFDNDLSRYLVLILQLVIMGTGIGFSLFSRRRNLVFAVWLVILVLVDNLSWQHHFVFLIFPFITVFYLLGKLKNRILFFLLAISYLLVSGNLKDPSLFVNRPVSIILSHGAFGAILLLLILFKIGYSLANAQKKNYQAK